MLHLSLPTREILIRKVEKSTRVGRLRCSPLHTAVFGLVFIFADARIHWENPHLRQGIRQGNVMGDLKATTLTLSWTAAPTLRSTLNPKFKFGKKNDSQGHCDTFPKVTRNLWHASWNRYLSDLQNKNYLPFVLGFWFLGFLYTTRLCLCAWLAGLAGLL